MKRKLVTRTTLAIALLAMCSPTLADWLFNDAPQPVASSAAGSITLELQCDRIRFAAATHKDAQDIQTRRGLSLRFMQNDSTETAIFQVGDINAAVGMVDKHTVEVFFHDDTYYDFVLQQMAENTKLNIAMADSDDSYGTLALEGSRDTVTSLRAACSQQRPVDTANMEAPEGVVYCGGGAVKRQIEFLVLDKPDDEWDARVTVNGKTIRAMTSYSYFGNAETPRGFAVALLGEDRSEFLVFREGDKDWLELGDYSYSKCN